jgi:predicted DNA-binding transcriptional regulator AlpA
MDQAIPDAAPTAKRLLSRDEVEATYGIAKRFLEIAACKGGGPAFVKVGRLTRYRVQDIEDWIARHRFASTSEVASNGDRA